MLFNQHAPWHPFKHMMGLISRNILSLERWWCFLFCGEHFDCLHKQLILRSYANCPDTTAYANWIPQKNGKNCCLWFLWFPVYERQQSPVPELLLSPSPEVSPEPEGLHTTIPLRLCISGLLWSLSQNGAQQFWYRRVCLFPKELFVKFCSTSSCVVRAASPEGKQDKASSFHRQRCQLGPWPSFNFSL